MRVSEYNSSRRCGDVGTIRAPEISAAVHGKDAVNTAGKISAQVPGLGWQTVRCFRRYIQRLLVRVWGGPRCLVNRLAEPANLNISRFATLDKRLLPNIEWSVCFIN